MGGIERANSMPAEAKAAEMVPKENGEEREDRSGDLEKEAKRSGDLEKEAKQRKDAESDYEPARDSVSSQGEGQSIEDSKVKRTSRVPQKLAKQHVAGSSPRTSKSSTNDRRESKLQFKTLSNGQKKSLRPNKGASVTKSFPEKKTEVTKIPDRPPSESSEGSDEKVIEEKTVEEVKEEEVKEMDTLDEAHSADQSIATDDETVDTEDNSVDGDKVVPYQKIEEMELRIEKLEEELREVAALEISLYSVVPEHGSSAHKVHTPARRLSRLYIHACKHWTQDKRATVARNTVSGLVLIAKSCGNDVPRLTFWLSNMVVLREIISQTFGVSSSSSVTRIAESNGFAKKTDIISPSLKWSASSPVGKQAKKVGLMQFVDDWQETSTFTAALEKIESWIFSRIVESVWWQTLTPHMQPPANDLNTPKTAGRLLGPALGDQDQGSFSIDLWKSAFQDAFTRLCPVRAGGHECGCLPVLARMVMEQCVYRLDVAMFNAILRESASEIPTDPVSDPIVDHKVLPIPAGDLSFGSGAQLKNSVGNWSRWLTDNFGMDDADDSLKDGQNQIDDNDDDRRGDDAVFKTFYLLNSLSDLLMLPKDMLLDKSIRKEVCPSIGLPLITRILCNFTPDEFCPDPVPGIILEELYAESLQARRSSEKYLVCSIPCTAAPIIYRPPSPSDIAEKVADAGGKPELARSASAIQRKGYTSDDDLDDLDSPLTSIIDKNMVPLAAAANGVRIEGTKSNTRYELLREVWSV